MEVDENMEKLVIFVPHKDDETNLAGNILSYLVKKYDVYVVYSSLEVNPDKASIRKKEAVNACAVYGIEKDNVIFLGLPDTPNRTGHHFFTDGDKNIVLKFEEILKTLMPEVIIGTDFDFHSDHRMVSLALDEAVFNIMNKIKTYTPLYLKGFCYETAYYGVDDYSATDLKNTKVAKMLLNNVSYKWEDRISLNSQEKNGFIFLKTPFKALKRHKSQYAAMHARKVINADNVFWEKRTDNLLIRDAKITATSGDSTKINDLKVIDTNDIITEDPLKIDYSKGLWKPDDSDLNPCINIAFNGEKNIEQIVLHGNPINDYMEKCNIEIHLGKQTLKVNSLMPYGQPTILNIDMVKCSRMEIRLLSKTCISEIEVFQTTQRNENKLNCVRRLNLNSNKWIDFFDRCLFKGFVLIEKVKRKIDFMRSKK